ncbi:MAG TPA: transglycosylase SLT domain-containing protein [Candidatus Nanoarchaeia archaeon]|nr:transglycosylase SLT domain-containing protein [Candidatus Nanoarchaeia archaeon]
MQNFLLSRRDFLKFSGLTGLILAGDLIIPDLSFAKSNKHLRKKLSPYLDNLSEKIIFLESSWNPSAYRLDTKATGLMGVTPIVVDEWNEIKGKKTQSYTPSDLFNPIINIKIGSWYLHDRIGKVYIPCYDLKDTPENKLACYNAGPVKIARLGITDAVEDFKKLPSQTREYIKKYWGL